MPWELPSVLSRIRRPVHRQRTPEPPSQDTVSQSKQEASTHPMPIDRKILQDPSSFLDAQVRDVLPRGLTPSTRLPSADSSGNARFRSRAAPTDPLALSGRSESPPGPSVDVSPRTPPKPAIGRITTIASSGEWSTFGRKREHQVPDVVGHSGPTSILDDPKSSRSPSPTGDRKHLSTDSTLSAYTLSRHVNPRTSTRSPGTRLSSTSSSPANTLSSKRDPRTPQGSHSHTAAGAPHATSLVAVSREPTFDSPHTFGHPTPPDHSVDFSYPPSAPPLPPLDHPELAAALFARRKSTSTSQPTLSAFRDRSNTLPTDHRAIRKDDLLPFKLGHSFPETKQATTEKQTPNARAGRRRARTISESARGRRTSADWSSYAATVGVTSHANQAWPAQVSRELLRLCGHEIPGPDLASGSSAQPKPLTRGRGTDPIRKPDWGTMSPSSFLPFPYPSRPASPPPSTAPAALTDGLGLTPARSRSLQFNLGNRRGRERLAARFTMAEVKRSLSSIEAWNAPKNGTSGASYASSGLGDPVPASSITPQALRHSSALTHSQSLLSGRVSATNTMSASPRGEPSTPTPAPRHLSDKSIGKRKAEDNIDLTPPEQKKEGQRATFLLPSEVRSQRISGSSHAPSSYHRKRARLSSTSPFATPVQSRPSSVQETPQFSASRNHHFTSLSSGTGARVAPPRTPSRAASTRSRQPPTPSTTRRHERHQSMSQISIPISAIVSPHAPSISKSAKFHMRDPHKPPKKRNDTPWGLRFTTEDDPGSPIQAWCFFLGFLLFPVWWIAGLFLRVPRTRIAGDVNAEKGVTIDDPQIEHDARAWRLRCRVMAAVSLFTYVPFIVLIAIFAPR